MVSGRTKRKPKARLGTLSDLARELDVTWAAAKKAVRAGRVSAPDAEGLVDLDVAAAEFKANRQRPPNNGLGAAQGRAGPELGEPDWKALLDKEKAIKAQLERRELQGSLVRRDAVDREHAELATLMRDKLRAIGKRIRDELAAESNARLCGEMVDEAIDEVLADLAKRASSTP